MTLDIHRLRAHLLTVIGDGSPLRGDYLRDDLREALLIINGLFDFAHVNAANEWRHVQGIRHVLLLAHVD